MTTPTKLTDGELINDEMIIQHLNGTSRVKEYQETYYLDLSDKDDRMVLKYLNPREYEKRIITDWDAEMNKPTERYIHPITKETIWVVKDYDTTPRRKIIKNKIYEPHPVAQFYLKKNGFVNMDEYHKERYRLALEAQKQNKK